MFFKNVKKHLAFFQKNKQTAVIFFQKSIEAAVKDLKNVNKQLTFFKATHGPHASYWTERVILKVN